MLGHFAHKTHRKTMASMYRRPRGGGNPLPPSYRNKALLIIAAIAVYTAFLYHSGKYRLWCNLVVTVLEQPQNILHGSL